MAPILASLGGAGSVAFAVGMIGASLLLGGVSMLLAGTPQIPGTDLDKGESPEDVPSYFFRGAVNTSGQGRPVPVLIGRLKIGSHVASLGVVNMTW